MQEIVDRFSFSTEDVRQWAMNMYRDRARRREDELRISECRFCSIFHDGYGTIYEKYGERNYGVASKELAERAFLTALKHELEYLRDSDLIRIGVWYTNYGIAAWQVSDHIHTVPSVMEKLLLGTLSPREEDKPVDVPVTELPRVLRLP